MYLIMSCLTKSSEFISMGARQVAVRQSINNLRGKQKKKNEKTREGVEGEGKAPARYLKVSPSLTSLLFKSKPTSSTSEYQTHLQYIREKLSL